MVNVIGNEDAEDDELEVCEVVIDVESIVGVGMLELELLVELELGVNVVDELNTDDELVLELAVVAVDALALHSPGTSGTSSHRLSA